jgi:hypothetical protein
MRWRAVAKELRREPWVNRALGFTAVVAVGFAVVTALTPDSGFARWGALPSELSAAYVGAWIFHLLVVVIPRVRDAANTEEALMPLLEDVARPGRGLVRDLAGGTDDILADEMLSRDWFTTAGERHRFEDQDAPRVRWRDGELHSLSWYELLWEVAQETERALQMVRAYLPLLKPEQVRAVAAAERSVLLRQLRVMGPPVPGMFTGQLSVLAQEMSDFVAAVEQVAGSASSE